MIEGIDVHLMHTLFLSVLCIITLWKTIDHLFFSCPVAKGSCRLLIGLKGKDFVGYQFFWSVTDVHLMQYIIIIMLYLH